MTCPLCLSIDVASHYQNKEREFWRCQSCALIFVPERHHPSREEERARYATHQNHPEDQGYRDFLNRLMEPLLPKLSWHKQGLDFGSGPGPTLSVMLEEKGYDVALYDAFFASDTTVLNKTYDFVTCTETAEHFSAPRREFERLHTLLKPGGWFAMMSETVPADSDEFASWYYHKDLTHVSFYDEKTYLWLAHHFDWRYESPRRNVSLFQKRE